MRQTNLIKENKQMNSEEQILKILKIMKKIILTVHCIISTNIYKVCLKLFLFWLYNQQLLHPGFTVFADLRSLVHVIGLNL